MKEVIKKGFESKLPKELANELLQSYEDVKANFYIGKFRPNEVEGGRFSEAVFRILEFITNGGKYTPLGKKIQKFEKFCEDLRNLPVDSYSDSIRLYIPRSIRLVYDIRNNRDAAHLGDDIDPNIQDASIVVSVCDWVMAELVRLFHNVTPDEAHRIINDIVSRKVPAIQEFGNKIKTLNPNFSAEERILVVLYHRGSDGANREELSYSLKPSQRANILRTLRSLENDQDFIASDGEKFKITRLGEKEVERRKLFELK